MKNKKITLPPIGMRIIKSAIGVFLGFVIYLLRGKNGTPFYTALSVLWCMQPQVSDSKSKAIQRTIGTMIGAFYGMIMILIEYYFGSFQSEFIRFLLISLFIIPVIYTTIVFNKKNASYFSCVVFLSIVVVHITDDNPYFFVVNRVLDTMIGIVLAFLINTARIPRKKRKDILFVSELDKVLLTMEEKLTPYSKFELNQIIEDGANFTIATMRPPAALLSAINGINLKLPVVVMNGAMLFDVKKNRCLKVYEIENSEAKELITFFNNRNFHCFVNVVVEDSVIIYYGEFKNDAEKRIYDNLRSSPYRNYMKEELPDNHGVAYLMIIDKREKIEKAYKDLKNLGYVEKYKILKYDSDDYPEYTYIKIYNKEAEKKNMIEYVKNMVGAEEVTTIGNIEGIENNVTNEDDPNKMIKKLKGMYEPYFWK